MVGRGLDPDSGGGGGAVGVGIGLEPFANGVDPHYNIWDPSGSPIQLATGIPGNATAASRQGMWFQGGTISADGSTVSRNNAGGVAGRFAAIPGESPTTAAGIPVGSARIVFNDFGAGGAPATFNSSFDGAIFYDPDLVPEPSRVLLLGVTGLLLLLRRSKRA